MGNSDIGVLFALAALVHAFELGLILSTGFNNNNKILNKLFQMVN
jgi:hypothetical protein